MHPTYMQAEYTFVEQMQMASRRPVARQNRGRVAASPGIAGGGGGGGNTTNVIAVGATAPTATAINNANNFVQVGA